MKSVGIVLASLAVFVVYAPESRAQQVSPVLEQGQPRVAVGTVVSSGTATLVLRTDAGQFVLFALDRDTIRPTSLPRGARVSVTSRPGDSEDVSIATVVTRLADQTPSAQERAAGQEPVPPSVRRLERQIERQVRRYRVGVRGGVALDPELISVGAHASLGPFFDSNVSFRPNLELAFGEVTTLLALNLEGIYRIPPATRQSRWSAYVGAGPNFSFSHRNFEGEENGQRFDFGEFNWDTGLNFLVGAENRSGVFIELKATAYAGPHVRLLIGRNF